MRLHKRDVQNQALGDSCITSGINGSFDALFFLALTTTLVVPFLSSLLVSYMIFFLKFPEVSVIIYRGILVETLIDVTFYDLLVKLSLSLEHGRATLSNHRFFLFLFTTRSSMSMRI